MNDTYEFLMKEDKETLAKLCIYYSSQCDKFDKALDKACEEASYCFTDYKKRAEKLKDRLLNNDE